MSLAKILRNGFAAVIRTRGKEYFASGRVEVAWHDESGIAFFVDGSGGATYEVEFEFNADEPGSVEAVCDCPYFHDGILCKHIWACVLTIDLAFPMTVADDGNWVFSDGLEPGERPPSKWASNSDELWRQGLDRVRRHFQTDETKPPVSSGRDRERQPIFLFRLLESIEANRLVIELRYREMLRRGWSQPKPLKIGLYGLPRWLMDSPDAELVRSLRANHRDDGYGWNSIYQELNRVQPSMEFAPAIVKRLCQTGRFFDADLESTQKGWDYERPLSWSDRPATWKLRVDEDAEEKVWRLSGELHCDGSPLPEDQLQAVFGERLLYCGDRFSDVHFSPADKPWIDTLILEPTIEVPFADQAAWLEQWYALPDRPHVEVPEAWQVPTETVRPQPVLRFQEDELLASKKQTVTAQLEFDYPGALAGNSNAGSVYDPEQNRVLVADLEAQASRCEELQACGFTAVDAEASPDASVPSRKWQVARERMVSAFKDLIPAGWLLQMGQRKLRQAGDMSLRVSSGTDWFDLDGTIDFDGVSASLPQLLKAVRDQQSFVTLADGTQGLISDDWIQALGGAAKLARLEKEAVRFSRSQALMLDPFLEAAGQTQVDEAFRKLRKRLASFRGIKPRKEPRGFQGELRDYQKLGLGWLEFLEQLGFGGCLADDMGLGKTIQLLAFLQAKKLRYSRTPKAKREPRRPSLVVAPKSLVFNWIEEAGRFAPGLSVLDSTGVERKARWEQVETADLIVTTYGTLRRDIDHWREHEFETVVLDEAQAIKNPSSQSAKAVRLLAARQRLALTGTPVENHLGELWSLFEFLNPGMLGRQSQFQSWRSAQTGDLSYAQRLAAVIKPFLLRRTKDQVLKELPPKTQQSLVCELPKPQRRVYDELRNYYRKSLSKEVKQRGIEQSKIQILEALLRLRQAACHPGLLDPKQADQPSGKMEMLLRKLTDVVEEGHSALVFSQFRSMLDLVASQLDKSGIGYERLDGQTRQRKQRVERFQSGDVPVFLISLKAGGVGLNLTRADYVYVLDPWWNPAAESQAIDRAHRIGQTRPVFAYRLIAQDTIEEKILQMQAEKQELAEAIVGADKSLLQKLTADDLQALLA